MSKTPKQPPPLEDRVRDLEASRGRYRWILVLVILGTCGSLNSSRNDTNSYEVPSLRSEVQILRNEVRRLSDTVVTLSDEVDDAKSELQRLSGG